MQKPSIQTRIEYACIFAFLILVLAALIGAFHQFLNGRML